MLKMNHKTAKRSLNVLLTAALLGTVFAQPAFAQLSEQTGVADPSRAADSFRENITIPRATPKVEVGNLGLEGAPAGSENIRFVLNSLSLEGIGTIGEAELQKLYADKIGTEITLAELYGVANDVTVYYRNKGYVLTRAVVPAQTIDGGNVRLQVVEGFIDQIIIQGPEEEGRAMETIREYAANISNGGALHVRDLEKGLLTINDLPGVSARGVINRSQTPGAADLLIIVERDPWDALASLDNYGSRYLGPVQATGALNINNPLGFNDLVTSQVVITPGDELAYGGLGYEIPIGPYGTKARIFGSLTDTNPGFDLEQFEVHGRSELLSLQVTHPFIRSREMNLNTRAVLDLRHIESESNVERREDTLRVARLGGRFDFLDTFIGVGYNSIDLELSRGLSIFGASDKGDANLTRDLGDPQFTKLEAEVQRLQRITDTVNLLVVGRGQWAAQPLLSSEEFAVGGINLGRGYDPSEVSGDDGIAGKAEVQWNSPFAESSEIVEDYQVFGFYDIGRVWDQDPTTNSQKRDSVASTGAGVRIGMPQDIQADFTVAIPLTREVQTQDDEDPRFYFSVSKRF